MAGDPFGPPPLFFWFDFGDAPHTDERALTALQALAIFAAGGVAGTLNSVVGSGSIFTFPVLLAFGYAPVVANVSNTVGLVPGSAAGAVGYRSELRGQRRRTLRLAAMTVSGAIVGATLLLILPASAFREIVPAFLALALVLIVLQPRINRALAARGMHKREHAGAVASAAVFVTGVYGGYFGAAQGILLLGILGLSLNEDLQRINALKVVLAGLANMVAGIVFVIAAHVAWDVAVLIAGGSVIGGYIGAHGGRRLPDGALRALIVVVGIVAIVRLAG